MATLEVASFAFTAFIGGIAVLRAMNEARKSFCTILLNILFGGTLFIMLNLLGYLIPLNFITGGIVALLGVPGIVLIIILKTIFGIF